MIAVDLLPLDLQTARIIERNIGNSQFHTIQGDFRHAKEDINDLLLSFSGIDSKDDEKDNINHTQVDCIVRYVNRNYLFE